MRDHPTPDLMQSGGPYHQVMGGGERGGGGGGGGEERGGEREEGGKGKEKDNGHWCLHTCYTCGRMR